MLRFILLIPVLLMFLSGCIVVRSDAARVDPETGAFLIDLRSASEQDLDADDDDEGHDDDDDDDDEEYHDDDDDDDDHDDDDDDDDEDEKEEEEEEEEEIDQKRSEIEQMERKLHQGEIQLEIFELQWGLAEDAAQYQAEADRRTVDEAHREQQLFDEFGVAEQEHDAHQSLANAEHRLKDAADELEQLSILYDGSELEDGTAEVVLSRGRRGLEQASHSLDQARRDHHLALEIELPKKLESLERASGAAERALERGEVARQIAQMEHELAEQEQHRALDELREKLDEARHELREMTGEVETPGTIAWRFF